MKLKTLLIGCFGGFIMLNSCTESPSVKDYSAYVNPFIGTGGHGHTFPGAVVPHGMIQPSPDTRIDGWDAISAWISKYIREIPLIRCILSSPCGILSVHYTR